MWEVGQKCFGGTVSSGGTSELARSWPAEAESKARTRKWRELCVGNVLSMI